MTNNSNMGRGTAAANGNALAAVDAEIVTGPGYTPALSMVIDLAEAEKRHNLLLDFIRRLMKDGQHYGIIPGTGSKPTLYKAGAEKLCAIYGLAPIVEIVESVEDFDGGFIKYIIRVRLVDKRTGIDAGQGLGSCNSRERKYAGPIASGKQTVADFANTILKMAKKRAHVDATLSATGTSGIFEQDLDDEPPNHGSDRGGSRNDNRRPQNAPGRGAPARESAPQAQPQAQPMTSEQRAEIQRLATAAYGADDWQRIVENWQQMPLNDWGQRRAASVIAELQKTAEPEATPFEAAPADMASESPAPQAGGSQGAPMAGDDDSDPFADE